MTDVHRIGFTQLSGTNDAGNLPRVNIIFVHGLRGHPRRTWESEKPSSNTQLAETGPEVDPGTEAKQRRFLGSLKKVKRAFALTNNKQVLATNHSHPTSIAPTDQKDVHSSSGTIFWPADFLSPDLPNARIWTYGYNTDVIGIFEAKNQNSISQHGRDLQVELERIDHQDPIIFVAHSLGGIVVKDAVRRSKKCRSRIKGIVFLGTPHRGASIAEWHTTLKRIVGIALQDSATDIVRSLRVDGEVLGNIQDEFMGVVLNGNLKVHSFQEARGLTGVKGFAGKVVDNYSSQLGLPDPYETVESIDANHMQMARCAARADLQYRKISAVLQQFISESMVKAEESEQEVEPNVNGGHTQVSGSNAAAGPTSKDARPPLFLVSFERNHDFVGRHDMLETLQKQLFTAKQCNRLALVGLGGIGKTQVALELAFWVKEKFADNSVLWLPAYSQESFEQQCAEAVQRLSIKPTTDADDVKRMLLRHLESASSQKWFIIVDNADDKELFFGTKKDGKVGFSQYLPKTENCTFLFTTRSKEVAWSVARRNTVDLTEMSSKEADEFLDRMLGPQKLANDQDSAKKLLQELSYLPLAISQAAAYIECNSISIQRYLELFYSADSGMIDLLSREFEDTTRYPGAQNAIATTWLISFDQIGKNDPTAAEMLSYISLIEPRAIPKWLLPQHESEEERENAIGTLCGYAFISRRKDENVYDMHRLVHIATRFWISKRNQAQQAVLGAIQCMIDRLWSISFSDRKVRRQCLPHTQKLLQSSNTCVIGDKYRLLIRVGALLGLERRNDEALDVLLPAYRYASENLPEQDPLRLYAQFEMGCAYLSKKQVKKAISILEDVVAIGSRVLDEEDHNRLTSQYGLARAYLEDEQVKKAISMLEDVVAIESRLLDEEDHNRLTSQHQLARAYLEDEQVKKAISMLEDVVAIRSRLLDEENYDRLTSQYELARAYLEDEQVKKAISMLEDVVAIGSRVLDEEDHNRLTSQHGLARAYLEDKQVKRAISILEDVVAIESRLLDEEDESRLVSEAVLAEAYGGDNRLEAAIELRAHIVDVRARMSESSERSRLIAEHNLAHAYYKGNLIGAAIHLFEYVVATQKKAMAPDDPFRIMSEKCLILVYSELLPFSSYESSDESSDDEE